jgi:hypothetical protein
MRSRSTRSRRGSAPTLAFVLMALTAAPLGSAAAAEPGTLDGAEKLCCGVPPRDEVTADQVFGRWVVTTPGIGLLRAGDRIEFRRDGTVSTAAGPCRFAVLRAELTVACAEKSESGPLRFVDDTKLIWRIDGSQATFIVPAE